MLSVRSLHKRAPLEDSLFNKAVVCLAVNTVSAQETHRPIASCSSSSSFSVQQLDCSPLWCCCRICCSCSDASWSWSWSWSWPQQPSASVRSLEQEGCAIAALAPCLSFSCPALASSICSICSVSMTTSLPASGNLQQAGTISLFHSERPQERGHKKSVKQCCRTAAKKNIYLQKPEGNACPSACLSML